MCGFFYSTNNLKSWLVPLVVTIARDIGNYPLCKITNTDQNTSGSTSHAEQELHFDIEQQPTAGHITSEDLDHEIVIGEAELGNSLCPAERYVPHDCKRYLSEFFGKNHPIRLKPEIHWFETYDFLHYAQERDIVICLPCTKTLQERKFPNNLKIEPAFTNINIEFCNWKKAIEKFNDHRNSRQHEVALEVQLFAKGQDTISAQQDAAIMDSQEQWRSFLVKVITSLK